MQEASIQQFESEQFGTIRTTTIDGEPWFVVSDICTCFGITNRNRVLQQVDDEDKGGTQMDTPGGKQKIAVVNESGLYTILFYIQPAKARGLSKEEVEAKYAKVKAFKRWVTHEVLPSIRKHGAYITPQTMADMMADPRNIAKVFNALADEQQKNQALTEDNARMLPKAVAYDSYIDADGTMSVRDAARMLSQIDKRINSKRLYALLRADELVCKQSRCPTKKATDRGLARQVIGKKTNGDATEPYIHLTQKGIDWCMTHYVSLPAQMKAM